MNSDAQAKALKTQGKNHVLRLIENQLPRRDRGQSARLAKTAPTPRGGPLPALSLPLAPTPFTISGYREVRV